MPQYIFDNSRLCKKRVSITVFYSADIVRSWRKLTQITFSYRIKQVTQTWVNELF